MASLEFLTKQTERRGEMNRKKSIILSLLTTFLFIFITQSAIAGADWQEKQKQMFARIPVKPGDVVDQSNWEKVKDILPESVVNWVKRGEWILKIDEFKYDFDYTPEWYELSAKNKGRYGLGAVKEWEMKRNCGLQSRLVDLLLP